VWVCGRSPAEIVGSNPTGDMDVCVNKYLHTVASVGFLVTLNYDTLNHELKMCGYLSVVGVVCFQVEISATS